MPHIHSPTVMNYYCSRFIFILFWFFSVSACLAVQSIQIPEPTKISDPTREAVTTASEVFPATLKDYVEQANLEEIISIYRPDGYGFEHHFIEDRQVIDEVVQLLKSPEQDTAPDPERYISSLMIVFHLSGGRAVRAVSLDCDAEKNRVALENIVTWDWPVRLKGSYDVPGTYCEELFAILGY